MKIHQKALTLALGVAVVMGMQIPAVIGAVQSEGALMTHNHGFQTDSAEKYSHGKEKIQKFKAELGLDAEQEARIKAIKEAFRQDNQAALDSLKAKHKQAIELNKNGQTEEAKALFAQMKSEREALKPQFMALKEQIKSVLTPEQQALLQNKLEECKSKKRHGKPGQHWDKPSGPTNPAS